MKIDSHCKKDKETPGVEEGVELCVLAVFRFYEYVCKSHSVTDRQRSSEGGTHLHRTTGH